MTKIPVLTSRDVIKGLKRAGFKFDRQAKGSHEIWYNPDTKRRTTIPNHPGAEIKKGTLKAILEQAGLSLEEFEQLL
ncbi:MAG: type II toxin-antitoxin system HicA family toxin [Methanothrix sp.]|nr:type II toxin-antitoxin system HicA family toxin [Methanothrix sp.]MDD4448415.1 type II toxin-antitoxin system HicA family toxin [Methanothrix sp.]